jgi:thiamine-phosphate diphosphorylase
VHGLDEARRCEDAGTDYLLFGPVFATPSKAAYGPPQGVAALERVLAAVGVPVWAIGGIGAATAGRLRGLPIAGVAVVSAAALAPDPAGAIRSLAAALGATARRRPGDGLSRRESSRR